MGTTAVPALQAFGNFSRTHGTRTWMIEKRIDEAMVILLDHSEVTVVTAVAGVLMNFSADPDHMQLFTQFGAMGVLLLGSAIQACLLCSVPTVLPN